MTGCTSAYDNAQRAATERAARSPARVQRGGSQLVELVILGADSGSAAPLGAGGAGGVVGKAGTEVGSARFI
eukprot:2856950-Prymnesium_polylepis.2